MSASGEQIATVDLGPWRTDRDEKTARQLVDAFERTGFAYATGHGVDPKIVSDLFDASKQFFHQSPEALDEVHYRHANKYHGYVPAGITPAALHELYDTGVKIPNSYDGPGAELRRTPNLWPPDLPEFRPTIERYHQAMLGVAQSALDAIAVGLSLPPDFFSSRCHEPHAQMRLLHYLQAPETDEPTFSVGHHCDYEVVTVLANDGVGGLQVKGPHGSWIDVPPIEGAFVLNAGDMMTRWTNGLLPATPHRVISPTDTERYAVAFFYATSYDVIIEPALPPARPGGEVYEPISTGAYMYKMFTEEGI